MHHRLIKAVEIREEIVRVIYQPPLSPSVFIAPSVALTREVDPFRMTELIPHEGQVAAVDGGGGHESDHLMQGYTAVCHIGRVTVLEMPVHIRIHEAEDNRLVAYQRLIVALRVGDGLLVLAPVRHLKQDMSGFPVFVLHLFDILDPEIRNTHRQAVIEAYTAIFYLRSQTRHAAHLLCDGDSIGLYLMNHFVSECQIHDRVAVFVAAEVRAVTVEVLA